MSDHLKAFLSAWLKWAEGGAPEKKPFSRHYGLCSNLHDWKKAGLGVDCTADLHKAFIADGLDECHPFGFDEYDVAQKADAQHLDVKRIAWVRAKVAQFEVV